MNKIIAQKYATISSGDNLRTFLSFDEYFKITDIQVHRDVQQIERKEGIENLYDKLLPEIRQLIGY